MLEPLVVTALTPLRMNRQKGHEAQVHKDPGQARPLLLRLRRFLHPFSKYLKKPDILREPWSVLFSFGVHEAGQMSLWVRLAPCGRRSFSFFRLCTSNLYIPRHVVLEQFQAPALQRAKFWPSYVVWKGLLGCTSLPQTKIMEIIFVRSSHECQREVEKSFPRKNIIMIIGSLKEHAPLKCGVPSPSCIREEKSNFFRLGRCDNGQGESEWTDRKTGKITIGEELKYKIDSQTK